MTRITVMVLSGLIFAASGCQQQGPAEQAGEEIDEAVEDMASDFEQVGRQIDETAAELQDSAEQAAERIEEGLEEAREEMQQN